MAIKALIFGTDDLYPQLKPFYDLQVQAGNLEIVGTAVFESDGIKIYSENNLNWGGGFSDYNHIK